MAIEVAKYFGLTKVEAAKISKDIREIVKNNWAKIAGIYGISRESIEYMRPAFSLLNLML